MCYCLFSKSSSYLTSSHFVLPWFNTCLHQWRIQSWCQGGFPNVANVSGWWGSVPVTVSPSWFKKKSWPGGGWFPDNQKTPWIRHCPFPLLSCQTEPCKATSLPVWGPATRCTYTKTCCQWKHYYEYLHINFFFGCAKFHLCVHEIHPFIWNTNARSIACSIRVSRICILFLRVKHALSVV